MTAFSLRAFSKIRYFTNNPGILLKSEINPGFAYGEKGLRQRKSEIKVVVFVI